nr:hypothetical protein [Tanacetum cinerariifolium]
MVSNVDVLGPGVLYIIASESNGTAIVTTQGNLIEHKALVGVKSNRSASLQERVLVITALKEQLKGKAVDAVPLLPKLHKNRTAHVDYLKHTLEEAATLRELVESEILLSPLNTPLAYACKYTRRIQELLMILQQTCPRITDLGTKPVAVTLRTRTN